MPFTPLHLGLGTCVKAVTKHRFSLLIFSGTQALMDIEPLIGLLQGWSTLHLYTHNLLGALLIGCVAILIGKPICEQILRGVGARHSTISWQTAIFSAMFGSFSHILLDAFMHRDMYPFFPISLNNPLLRLIPYSQIFYFCVLSLIIGGIFSLVNLRLSLKTQSCNHNENNHQH